MYYVSLFHVVSHVYVRLIVLYCDTCISLYAHNVYCMFLSYHFVCVFT